MDRCVSKVKKDILTKQRNHSTRLKQITDYLNSWGLEFLGQIEEAGKIEKFDDTTTGGSFRLDFYIE